MNIKIYSWSKWDDDGLIEVKVSKEILKEFANKYEEKIDQAIRYKRYEEASKLISDRKALIEKIKEAYDGTSID